VPARPSATNVADAPGYPQRIRMRGELCEIDFDGREVSVRISKGVADIVRLIQADGRELHCTELADVAVEQSSTGEVIDATAKREYEDRVRELQAEIEDAEARTMSPARTDCRLSSSPSSIISRRASGTVSARARQSTTRNGRGRP